MNAKELIEAATRLRERHGEWRYVEGDSSYFKDVIASCDHILATVRPDDDEPVTPERLNADGWVSAYDGAEWLHEDFDYKLAEWGDGFICLQKEVRSMGHLRRLVAALGE
jgi:hypothetical protein